MHLISANVYRTLCDCAFICISWVCLWLKRVCACVRTRVCVCAHLCTLCVIQLPRHTALSWCTPSGLIMNSKNRTRGYYRNLLQHSKQASTAQFVCLFPVLQIIRVWRYALCICVGGHVMFYCRIWSVLVCVYLCGCCPCKLIRREHACIMWIFSF